jgi:hypothetical protein
MSHTTQSSVTPYAAAKVVNAVLAAAGVDKTIPPQMMYNYTTARLRAGKAPLIACDADGRITREGLEAWLVKYLPKQGVTTTTDEEATAELSA